MGFVDQLIYRLDKEAQFGDKELVKKHKNLVSLCLKGKSELKIVIDKKFNSTLNHIEKNLSEYYEVYKALAQDKVQLDFYLIYDKYEKDIRTFISYYKDLLKIRDLYIKLEKFNKYMSSCVIYNKKFYLNENRKDTPIKFNEFYNSHCNYSEIYKELIEFEKYLTDDMPIKIRKEVTLFFKNYKLNIKFIKCFSNLYNDNLSNFKNGIYELKFEIKNNDSLNCSKMQGILKIYENLYNKIVNYSILRHYLYIDEVSNSIEKFKSYYEELKKIYDGFLLLENINKLDLNCGNANKELFELYKKEIYIDYKLKSIWISSYSKLYEEVTKEVIYIEQLKDVNYTFVNIDVFKDNFSNIDRYIINYNKTFIKREKLIYNDIFHNVEGKALDNQQIDCIVKDEINNLVIAGAGSGKTTTIVGKVKYLLKKEICSEKDILIISFNNASSTELYERISKEIGSDDISVATFHKLGLDIIASVEGVKPSLFSEKLIGFVARIFNVLMKNNSYKALVNNYFLSYLKPYKTRSDFENEGQYIEYIRDNNLFTLNGDRVKSLEEMEIANFLFINNIEYIYENKYEIDVREKKYSQYKPDFYLPQYKIYIEHFGIDRKGNVASFFKGKNASKFYNYGIEWKRKTHKENNTILIETFSYEKREGNLLSLLKEKLIDKGVTFTKYKTQEEVWNIISKNSTEVISFHKLITTFINQLKSNELSLQEIEVINDENNEGYDKIRNIAFLKIINPIYNSYLNDLKENKEIDFNDMILEATAYIKDNRFINPYSYIIIDEYQDISFARYKLVKSLKEQNNCKLFCVGDDWQSIYKFVGSKVRLFTNFKEYFGFTEKSYIEKTYRFSKSIIDLSSTFILKNKTQINKKLLSTNDEERETYKIIYGKDFNDLKLWFRKILNVIPSGSTVAIISRYSVNIDFAQYLDIDLKYSIDDKDIDINYNKRKDLSIKYFTIHKSKGLEADYVIILNNSNNRLGFPSRIEDDDVLKLFNKDEENFELAEERRLFYVAITRAKRFTYLLVEENSKSPFIREIEDYKDNSMINSHNEVKKCPVCVQGKLVLRKGKFSDFYGCSNYPYCEFKIIK